MKYESGAVTDPFPSKKAGALAYRECGTGTPLLLLHGLTSTSACWGGVANRLAPHFRVIAPDLLGFGGSDAPSGDGYMDEQARSIRALLEALQVGHLLVGGHDFGGPVAMTLMRLYPGLPVRGVVLSNTNMFTDTPIPLPLRTAGVPLLGALVYRVLAGSRFGLRLTYRMAVARKGALSWPEFSRGIDSRNLRLTQRIFQRSLADLEGNYRDVQGQLRATRVPVLVPWGDQDPFFPIEVGDRTAACPSAGTFKRLRGTGHFAPHEDPSGFADAVLEWHARAQALSRMPASQGP